ncbi:MAG TPA: prepilin peptidase [Candidatus Paceibacterota bacterium]|nr:prepilin peptidase [Candidatus Paceibacterota bacterium]
MLFIPVLVFIFGTIIGSFLNVVIYRINTGRSVAKGRSKCAICSTTLHWQELVPVFSFLALGGKCKTCRTKISFQYPVVELLSGLLFTVLYIHILIPAWFSPLAWLEFCFVAALVSLALVIGAYDFRHKIIPVVPMWITLALSIVALGARLFLDHSFPIVEALVAGPLVAAPFFLLWGISRGRWMGFGDVKLALALGWLFGIGSGFTVVLVSFWIGGLTGLFLLALSNRYSMQSQVPFAPFLLVAALVVYFWSLSLSSFLPL